MSERSKHKKKNKNKRSLFKDLNLQTASQQPDPKHSELNGNLFNYHCLIPDLKY